MYIIHIQGEIGMFCTKCGAKNPEDATFCYKCGNEMATVKQEKETERPKSFNDDVQNKTSLLKNKKWLYSIIAVAVLLLGFGGYKWYVKHCTFLGAVSGHIYKVKEGSNTFYTGFRENKGTVYYYITYSMRDAEKLLVTKEVFNDKNYSETDSGVKALYNDGDEKAVVFMFDRDLKENKSLPSSIDEKNDFKLTKNGYIRTVSTGSSKGKEVGTLVK